MSIDGLDSENGISLEGVRFEMIHSKGQLRHFFFFFILRDLMVRTIWDAAYLRLGTLVYARIYSHGIDTFWTRSKASE